MNSDIKDAPSVIRNSQPPISDRPSLIPRRFLVILATFSLSVLLYIDRTCISTAKEAVTAELGLSKEQWSWVLAAFAFGYALFRHRRGDGGQTGRA